MKIEKAIEDLKDINTILKTQHMCKVLDDELTKKDVEDYKSRFASVNLAISALEKQLNGGWIPVSDGKYIIEVKEGEVVSCQNFEI